jgi:hypothetical protein
MKQRFSDYFRCPDDLVDFRLSAELAPRAGFFRFGPDLMCYGRTISGRTQPDPSGSLEDVFSQTRTKQRAVYLPFNIDEVVENLRQERYSAASLAHNYGSAAQSVACKIYYIVRPFLPTFIRQHIQRLALHHWDERPFPSWPIDHTVDRLFESAMAFAIRANSGEPIPFIWFWPEGFSSCAIMTHDVETAVGRDFCPTLMDVDGSFDIKSSFQLVPEGRYSVSEFLLRSIRDRGFEVNVHDFNHDGRLFKRREEFLRRVARINAYGKKFQAAGYRSGVLYRNLDWYDSFDYSYDMSVPNVGHLDPQPGGCCTTKPYFIGKILEIPVVATQDYTLFHILRQYSVDLWEREIQLTLGLNGLISFIVHPDYLVEKRARDVYIALLECLSQARRDAGMWITLPRELNQWWRNRSQMRLLRNGSAWSVAGPDSHRARIAYASLQGERVSYTFENPAAAPSPPECLETDLHASPAA